LNLDGYVSTTKPNHRVQRQYHKPPRQLGCANDPLQDQVSVTSEINYVNPLISHGPNVHPPGPTQPQPTLDPGKVSTVTITITITLPLPPSISKTTTPPSPKIPLRIRGRRHPLPLKLLPTTPPPQRFATTTVHHPSASLSLQSVSYYRATTDMISVTHIQHLRYLWGLWTFSRFEEIC
jgi:hypothetical protein